MLAIRVLHSCTRSQTNCQLHITCHLVLLLLLCTCPAALPSGKRCPQQHEQLQSHPACSCQQFMLRLQHICTVVSLHVLNSMRSLSTLRTQHEVESLHQITTLHHVHPGGSQTSSGQVVLVICCNKAVHKSPGGEPYLSIKGARFLPSAAGWLQYNTKQRLGA